MEHSPETAFGRVLRRVRRERDLSQEALADRAGLARNHVSEIERARRDPRLTTLVHIADALDMGLGELLALFDAERAGAARA